MICLTQHRKSNAHLSTISVPRSTAYLVHFDRDARQLKSRQLGSAVSQGSADPADRHRTGQKKFSHLDAESVVLHFAGMLVFNWINGYRIYGILQRRGWNG